MQKVGFFQSVHFKIAIVYVLLLLVAMQLIGVYFVDRIEDQFVQTFNESLERNAKFLSYSVAEKMEEAQNNEAIDLREQIAELLDDPELQSLYEVQVIASDNLELLGTSREANAENIGKRTTERIVQQAMLKEKQVRQRVLGENGERMQLLVYPIKPEGELLGAIYIKASMEEVYRELRQINQVLAAGTIISLLVTGILGVFLSRTITRPMADMRRRALQIAYGDFSRKVKVYGNDEIGQLAIAFNQMTEKLEEANAQTEGERKKLRSVLAHMTDGVIATDREGHVILMNDRAEELLNVYRQNVLGSPLLSLLKLEDKMNWETVQHTYQSILLDFSSDENKQILRANFSVIQKENGPFNGVIVVLHDVTEQQQIEEERREFVSNVSHELRTPLTTLKSYLEALSEGAMDDRRLAAKFLNVVQKETERMIRLVNDLLQLSKMDAKDYTLNTDSVDFIGFLNKIIDRFEMAKSEKIQFVRKLPQQKLYVNIDRDKMTQVLDNIISNALKYSPDGGKVTFRVRNRGDRIFVTISDEGVGIPKNMVGKIFERFYRVDKARSRKLGGTGLGLAITREMVHAHGGEIWADSEWNRGTAIHFTLPVKGAGEVDTYESKQLQ